MSYNLTAQLRLIDNLSRPMRQATEATKLMSQATEAMSRTSVFATKKQSAFSTATAGLKMKLSDMRNTTKMAGDSVSQLGSKSNSTASTLRNWAAGIGTVIGAQKLLNATVGEAMKLDYNKTSLSAMFRGDQKAANELSNFIGNKAINSVMSYQDVLSSTQSFSALTKNTGQIKEMVNLTERLSYLNPMEGFEGAGFAIKEALGGDFVSIKDRFNLTNEQIAPLKAAATQAEKLKALDKVLTNIGIDTKYLDTVNNTTYAKWNKLLDTTKQFFVKLGESALKSVSPMIDKFTAFMEGKEFAGFQAKASAAFGSLFASIGQFAGKLYENRAAIMSFATGAIQVMADIGSAAKTAALFIVNNWGAIKPVLIGVAAGFAAFKVISTIVTVVNTATAAFGMLKATFGLVGVAANALKLTMLAGPWGWVALAVGAVIAAGVLLYKNWDTVKAKASELWAAIKEKWSGIKSSTSATWDSVKSKITGALSTAKKKVSDFFSPLLKFISDAEEKWNEFKSVFSNFKMPSIDWPEPPSWWKKITGGGNGKSGGAQPKHYHGLERVPYDGYSATLHKGERVLTRKEAKALDSGSVGGGINIAKLADQIIVREEADIDRIINGLFSRIQQAKMAGA